LNEWETLASRARPSWYLDPLVARQKREVNLELTRRWSAGLRIRSVLKTDLFEEAFGRDHILFDIAPDAALVVGIDLALTTARRAAARNALPAGHFLAADLRKLPFRGGCFDLIVSTSTLDHFSSAAEFRAALAELARILKPGGALIVTLDNLQNPFYRLLRRASRQGWTPFRLGYTISLPGFVRVLEDAGLEVTATDYLIHNPRGASTLLFLGLRRLFGRFADGPIRLLLNCFAALGRLPSRAVTACFVAACARKPEAVQRRR